MIIRISSRPQAEIVLLSRRGNVAWIQQVLTAPHLILIMLLEVVGRCDWNVPLMNTIFHTIVNQGFSPVQCCDDDYNRDLCGCTADERERKRKERNQMQNKWRGRIKFQNIKNVRKSTPVK